MLEAMIERFGATAQSWMTADGSAVPGHGLVDARHVLLRAHAAGGVALGIEIHQQDALARLREVRAEVHGGRRLANASFLVRKDDDLRHRREGLPEFPDGGKGRHWLHTLIMIIVNGDAY